LIDRQGMYSCRSPPLWTMGVAHALKFALQTIAHRVGSYKK
jgi:hypothetical protein